MKQRGFTLIEMVLTMLVSSILVLGIAGFIELGMKGYADSVDRQRMQTQAKFILEKMTREVRHAVPNIFVDQQNCISFYPIVESGFYAVSGSDISFIVGNSTTNTSDLNTKRLLINPTRTLASDETLADLNNSFPMTIVTQPSPSEAVFLLPNQSSKLVGGSVINRHYITDSNRRISYCILDGRVVRGEGNESVAPVLMPLTDRRSVSVSGNIRYTPASVQHSGVVHVDLAFTQNGESTHFQHDIQVLNVP
ncbi:PilW family protein [Vibrio renipiscarius]|uniref:MSHA biogenesis protein MshO n=1 Tax=Vibrio renipiscarius TaxID=1461322 RepID=A0A0C2JHX0_9VIBR|nr:prepilin-type N-terminal cleavage/methylation domain-containing protein [Vibrio renipiscarius]KII77569.1 MSHA biogenesis protein MshO [Vibrio renipiscarius]KII81151.1 MSHA biogenesis protein MshO [Vibrio renipiscarius]